MLAGLNRAIGTVNFLNYEAVWTPAEEEDKDSGKEEGKGTTTRAKDGSWSTNEFGRIEVYDNAKINFTGNTFDASKVKDRYSASLKIEELNFKSSAMKLKYKLDVETMVADIEAVAKAQDLKTPEGMTDWTSANIADNMKKWVASLDAEAADKFINALEEKTDVHASKFGADKIAPNEAVHTAPTIRSCRLRSRRKARRSRRVRLIWRRPTAISVRTPSTSWTAPALKLADS